MSARRQRPPRAAVAGRLLAVTIFLLVAVAPVTAAGDPGLDLLITGSMHGVLQSEIGMPLAKAAHIITATRATHGDALVMANGNMFGPAYATTDNGADWVVAAMNQCRFDVMVPGPHDLAIGLDAWWSRVGEARFPVVWTNLASAAVASAPDRARGNLRPCATWARGTGAVRVLGVISPEVYGTWPNWPRSLRLDPIDEALQRAASATTPASWTIVGGYLSFAEAQGLLQRFPWVDVVVTSANKPKEGFAEESLEHSFCDGRRIIWTRPPGLHLPHVMGQKDAAGRHLHTEARALNEATPQDPTIAGPLASVIAQVTAAGTPRVAELGAQEHQRFGDTIAAVLCHETRAEAALLLAAQIIDRPASTTMTLDDIRRMTPHNDRVAIVPLPGSTLRALWKRRHDRVFKGQGLLFTGLRKAHGRLEINHRRLVDATTYAVVTTEYLAAGGLGLLPPGKGTVKADTVAALVQRHFSRHPVAEKRQETRQQTALRPILRHHTSLGAAFSRLSFGGSAPTYQNPSAGGFALGRDVPGLIGSSYRDLNLELNWLTSLTRVRDEWLFRGENTLNERDGVRNVDRSLLALRWLRLGGIGVWRPFAEVSSLRPLGSSDPGNRRTPQFLQTLVGAQRRLSPEFSVLAGLIQIDMLRQSRPGRPRNRGFTLMYTANYDLPHHLTFNSTMNSIFTADEDKIRMYEGMFELKYKLSTTYALTLRERVFGWKESAIPGYATRNETFFGVTAELGYRRR